ncbi:MAG: hypothetical protein ACUVX8_01145 [Candidatus Zipacnadales bacterium]
MHLLILWGLLVCSRGSLVAAQDRDRDGLPDAIEVQLGTNPDLDEGLQLLIEDKRRGEGDTNNSGGQAPDVDEIFFAHVAGKRYVWKVTFAEDYPTQGTVFHLYTDIDNDPTTGRQDAEWVRGVDVMYSFVDAQPGPRVINAAVRAEPALPIRQVIAENALYVCDDLEMNSRNGETLFRMYILSHMREPASDSDTTAWVEVSVPLHIERKLPELPYPRPTNDEAITMPNLAQLLFNLWQDERTVRLLPGEAKITGYTHLMNEDLEGKGEPGEAVSWNCPVTGSYHIGLLLRDKPGVLEGLEVLVNGKSVGTFVGCASAGGDVLHFTREPVALINGQSIEVRTAKNGGR